MAPRLRAEINKLTSDFREGRDPFWLRLRSLLRAQAIEPERALLATIHSEDRDQWLGVVVSPERKVFRFIFNFVNRPIEAAEFSEWEELTERDYPPNVGEIECALEMIPRAPSN